ncbi:DNA-processing protein DprA [Microbacterium sp. p3-SID338]|uniref:DNA-processing protein DprA n=1 Tax=unclassified Microbacterium TaxID=2609290 RepID=UPI0007881752|nr:MULTISPECIES: DNA-processing protein DprA [unclassified Microbacterium]KYJ99225.1 DNA processing protein DprA [Microbacterium sp. CH1]MCT1394268.1 DNA-processing protein DprA [Microbacterium sp. p3-SID338]PMC03321.1 DNA-protecting protein DprA [Microbacterium sp. UMB0228]
MIDGLFSRKDALDAAQGVRGAGEVTETLARVAWSVVADPGDAVAATLVREFGPADGLRFALEGSGGSWPVVRAVGARRALDEARARWRQRADPVAVVAALRGAQKAGAQLLLPGDPGWPTSVDDLDAEAPMVLWVRGRAELLTSAARVAIVGARAATAYGERVAADMAGDLAVGDTAVVSGGAYGIDGAAHRAALTVGGGTIAVLAGGVDRPYPAGHRNLLARIAVDGVVVSEVPCGTAPTRWRFLARNRLIAALGQATVVVEAGWRSGSLNTAGHAATLGRPLGAVPGPVTSASSAGCHRLLREYDAVCVTSAAEVAEMLPVGARSPRGREATDEGRVGLLRALSTRTARTEAELAQRAGLTVERTRALLGLLDLDGLARRDGDGWRGRGTAP